MSMQADILTYNQDNQLTLVVEVKNKLGTDASWAAHMRRNLIVHGGLSAQFFLLAMPDYFYLWHNDTDADLLPSYAIKPTFLNDYLARIGVSSETLTSSAFEMLVWQWLSDVADHPENWLHLGWLTESGLLKAVQSGTVRFEL